MFRLCANLTVQIREGLQNWESRRLKFNPQLVGTRRDEVVVRSVQDAYDRSKQLVGTAAQSTATALEEVKSVRSTCETYGGYTLSVSALKGVMLPNGIGGDFELKSFSSKDNTMENLNGAVTGGISGGTGAGQAFSSWRQQLVWAHKLEDDDPSAPFSTPSLFGAILDIWHVVWIHLWWGACREMRY